MPKIQSTLGFTLALLVATAMGGVLLTGCGDSPSDGQSGGGAADAAGGQAGMEAGAAGDGSPASGSAAAGSGHDADSMPRTLEEAKVRAAAEGKPILIDFFAEWCGPCKQFTKASHSDPDLIAALEQVVLLKIDAEKGNGPAMARQYGVRGYPTFVLVSTEGKTITAWAGYAKDFFLESLNKALADLTPVDQRRARFEEEPTEGDAAALARYHAAGGDHVAAVALFQRAEQLRPIEDHAYAAEIFRNMARAGQEGGFLPEEVFAAADDVLAMDPEHREPWDLLSVAATTLELAVAQAQPQRTGVYVDAAVAEIGAGADPQLVRMREGLLADYACRVLKDPERAMRHKKASLAEGWEQRCDDLNGMAWWCFQNKIGLREAEAYARQGVALAEAGREKGMILDTLAEICLARGNTAEAVSLMEDALVEVPESEYYQQQLERFRDLASAN